MLVYTLHKFLEYEAENPHPVVDSDEKDVERFRNDESNGRTLMA